MKIQDFQLLTDENIHSKLLQYLREKGFDVYDVRENNLQTTADNELMDLAFEQNRVIVTHDSDFSTLVFTQNKPFVGIIYIRPGHFSPSFHYNTIDALLEADIEIESSFILKVENNEANIKIKLRIL